MPSRRSNRCQQVKLAYEASQSVDPLRAPCPEVLENLSRPYVFPKGVELFRQDFLPEYVYYLESGLIKLIFDSEDGHEVIITLARPGCVLGASEAILGRPYAVSAITVQRCRLRCIPASGFLETLETDHLLSLLVNRVLSREICYHLAHSAELAVFDARSRLEQLLWNLIATVKLDGQKGMVRLQLPITHEEIAELIAVTPQYLSRLFKLLTNEGVLHKEKGSAVVVDISALRHSANY